MEYTYTLFVYNMKSLISHKVVHSEQCRYIYILYIVSYKIAMLKYRGIYDYRDMHALDISLMKFNIYLTVRLSLGVHFP